MKPEFERSPRRERGEPQEGERWAPGVSLVFRISPGWRNNFGEVPGFCLLG